MSKGEATLSINFNSFVSGLLRLYFTWFWTFGSNKNITYINYETFTVLFFINLYISIAFCLSASITCCLAMERFFLFVVCPISLLLERKLLFGLEAEFAKIISFRSSDLFPG